MRSFLAAFVAAFWLAALVLSEAEAESFGRYGVAFAPRSRNLVQHSNLLINIRGGATESDDEDESDEEEDEEESDEEEDEEEEQLAAAAAAKAALKSKTKKSAKSTTKKSATSKAGLAASTVKASTKSKTQKAAAAKKAVNTNLLKTSATTTKTKKKKSSILKMLHIPYIIGACLNPVTLFKMTKGFWVSLFDLDYLKQVRRKLCRRSSHWILNHLCNTT
jgi:hypothetical protein